LSSDRRKNPVAVRWPELDATARTVNDFRSRDLLAESDSEIEGVMLREGTRNAVVLESKDKTWRFKQPPYGLVDYEGEAGAPDPNKPPTGLRAILNAVTDIKVERKTT